MLKGEGNQSGSPEILESEQMKEEVPTGKQAGHRGQCPSKTRDTMCSSSPWHDVRTQEQQRGWLPNKAVIAGSELEGMTQHRIHKSNQSKEIMKIMACKGGHCQGRAGRLSTRQTEGTALGQ